MGAPVPESTPPPVHILVPIWFNNNVHSDAYGMELAGKLQVTHFWRVSAAETWARMVLHAHSPQMPQGFMQILSGESPLEQLSIQSTFLLPRNLELNAASGYVSRLANQQVPPYTRLDFRLAWQPAERLQFSIGGQNLLAARHAEYRSLILAWPTEVRRSVYTRLEWTF
jgi:iron complex outermembrane receptor protein